MHAVIGKIILNVALLTIALAMLWLIVMGVRAYMRARKLGRRGNTASLLLPLALAGWIAHCIYDIINN